MWGVQQIFTQGTLTDMVEGTKALGIPILKCRYNDHGIDSAIADPFFTRIFLWYRSDGAIFREGMTDASIEYEYTQTYEYAKYLLTKFNGTDKKFYLGHWEGDWYLLPGMNANQDADPTRINGMIQWLNVRQKAIEQARRDIESTVRVYHYTEMNRTFDAYSQGMKRLVNTVLPLIDIDFVSVSSYDIQERSSNVIEDVLSYIERNANFSKDYPVEESRRVFIGEFGLPAVRYDYDEEKHCQENIKIFEKYEELGVPFILYWNFYNNEYTPSGAPKGFWVVDNMGKPVKLFYELQKRASRSM
jgi:hypothetical protein